MTCLCDKVWRWIEKFREEVNDVTNNCLEGFKEEDQDGDFEARTDTHKMIPQIDY
jgi:hypothetical protein